MRARGHNAAREAAPRGRETRQALEVAGYHLPSFKMLKPFKPPVALQGFASRLPPHRHLVTAKKSVSRPHHLQGTSY